MLIVLFYLLMGVITAVLTWCVTVLDYKTELAKAFGEYLAVTQPIYHAGKVYTLDELPREVLLYRFHVYLNNDKKFPFFHLKESSTNDTLKEREKNLELDLSKYAWRMFWFGLTWPLTIVITILYLIFFRSFEYLFSRFTTMLEAFARININIALRTPNTKDKE